MAYGVWQATIVNASTGRVAPYAQIRVLDKDGVLAPLFSNRTGDAVLSNPLSADELGFAQFYTRAGRYRIEANDYSGLATVWPDVIIQADVGGGHKTQTISPTDNGALDLSALDVECWVVTLDKNVTSILLPINPDADNAVVTTILFQQPIGGGKTISGWPVMDWEMGLLPLIDTSSNGKTTIQILLLHNAVPLGVY